MININLRGLRQILRRFDENGYHVRATHWSVARGGYDLQWELYYDRIPVVDCVDNEIINIGLDKKDFSRVAKIILEEYDINSLRPMTVRGSDN